MNDTAEPQSSGHERRVALADAVALLTKFEQNKPVEKPAKPVDERLDEIEAKDLEQNVQLRGLIAKWAMIGAGIQLGVADLAFMFYGFWSGWAIDQSVMITWLTASVLEVIGVVVIVANSLYSSSSTPQGRKRQS